MKAANKLFLALALWVFFGAPVFAESHGDGIASITHVHRKVVFLTEQLAARIQHCSIEKKHARSPKLDKRIVSGFNVNIKSLIQGLSYLSHRNFEACEGGLRWELAYQFGVLKRLGKHYEIQLPPIDGIEDTLIYPSVRDVAAEAAFHRLPANARKYLLRAVGDAPFDLLRTVSENRLLE